MKRARYDCVYGCHEYFENQLDFMINYLNFASIRKTFQFTLRIRKYSNVFLQHSRLFASGIFHDDGRFSKDVFIYLLEEGKLAAWYVKTDAMQIAESPHIVLFRHYTFWEFNKHHKKRSRRWHSRRKKVTISSAGRFAWMWDDASRTG